MMDKKTWPLPYFGTKYLWVIPLIIGFLIALLSPLDILAYGLARFIVTMMSSVIPMISKLNGQYEMTQITQFYFSAMWLMSPLVYFSFLEGGHFDKEKMVANLKKHKILLPIATVSISLGGIWFCIFIGPDTADLYDVRTNLTLHTRLGLASYGFLFPAGAAAFLAMFVMLKRHFREIYFH